MKSLTVGEARATLEQLLDGDAEFHEPIQIIGKRTTAVLVPEDLWRGIQETLYLLSIPGMRESILKGVAEPDNQCSSSLGDEWKACRERRK